MEQTNDSEMKDLQKQLQDVKQELLLVSHQLLKSSRRFRDTKRISLLRSASRKRILHPARTIPPRNKRSDQIATIHDIPGTRADFLWRHSLRLLRAKWEEKLSKNATVTDLCDRIRVDATLAVRRGGAKLVPLDGERPLAQQELSWNGWNYSSCPSGDFIRIGVNDDFKEQCRYFTRHGFCMKMESCPFEHNVHRITICRQYLAGKCDSECLLSHKPNAFNTAICRYEFQDTCHNKGCRYSHILPKHSKDPRYEIWTCRPFALGGYCERGHSCPFAHLFNCPDYEESGMCPRGKSCTLQHNITKRTQLLSANLQEEYGVFCAEEDDEKEKIIISSYTVEPKKLLAKNAFEFLEPPEMKEEFVFDIDLP